MILDKKMKNEFTPKQVMNGDVDYSLEDFLLDLFCDVKSSISKDNFSSSSGGVQDSKYDKAVYEVFRVVSEICFQAATNSPNLKLLLEKTKGEEKEFIKGTLKSNKDNIDLLQALLMRQLAMRLESGLTKRQAANEVITKNKSIMADFIRKSAKEFPR
jgi:hypothetical protein